MANKTVQDIYTATDSLLRQEGDTSGIPGLEEAQTIVWINDLHKQFFDEFLLAGRNYPTYMKREYGYTSVSATALAADVAAGATSFTVDSSTPLDTSGAGVIYSNSQYDIFVHTGNSGGTVSGVTLINFAHEEDDVVSKLYALPSTFGRFRIESDRETRGEGVRVNGAGYFQTPDLPSSRQYSLWQNPSDAAQYLWMPRSHSGDILITYDQKPTDLTTTTGTTGTIDIPSNLPDHWYLIYGLKGIFKQVLDEDYVPTLERQQQDTILRSALNRTNVGKKVSASSAYFRRYGL